MFPSLVLRLSVLLGMLLVAPLGVAANAAATHEVEDVTGAVFACNAAAYTITSGTMRVVMHERVSPSGNDNFTLTITPSQVVATDGTDTFAIRGASSASAAYNAQQGSIQLTVTEHFQIVRPGTGTVGHVQSTFHLSIKPGEVKIIDHNFGNCSMPT